MDLCVTGDVDALTRLWRNDTINNNHWITLNLTGACSNRSGIGARIEVTTDVRTTVKEVSSGAGRGSFNSLPVEFGLAEATAIEKIEIFWPSGIIQTLTAPEMDQILPVSEPDFLADLSDDCQVNLIDYALLVFHWLTAEASVDIVPLPDGDGIVDMQDLGQVIDQWLGAKTR